MPAPHFTIWQAISAADERDRKRGRGRPRLPPVDFDTHLVELDLEPRVVSQLEADGIDTLGALLNCTTGRLSQIPNFGQTYIRQCRVACTAYLRGARKPPPPEPETPTTATPGSEEKIVEMQRRAANGLAIFHSLDYRVMVAVIVACAVLAMGSPARADERGLPLVEEEVDEIAIVQTIGCEHCRVVFVRGPAVLATRLMVDDMLWAPSGDHFLLIWQDYWTAERVVSTRKISFHLVEADPTQEGEDGLWWCMFRNMRNLKEP